MNLSSQYNLNFVDWDNEWEEAYEAMDGDPDEQLITYFNSPFCSNKFVSNL
jgi:hypothetical protein